MENRLATIRRLLEDRDDRGLLLELKDLVPDYNPSKHVLQRLLQGPQAAAAASSERAA
jgi:hypothetical protein